MAQSYGRLDPIKGGGTSLILLAVRPAAAAIAFSKPHVLMRPSMSVCMEYFFGP